MSTKPFGAGGEVVPVRAHPDAVTAALRGLAAVGPYFAVDVPDKATVGDAAVPRAGRTDPPAVTVLYEAGPALAAAIDDVAARLGGTQRRVAASTFFLGYAARVWSIALGCWATAGLVPDLAADRLHARTLAGGPIRLEVRDAGGTRPADGADPDEAAKMIADTVIDGHLRSMVTAVRAQTRPAAATREPGPLATGLLWGNAASALVGTVRMLGEHTGPARAREVDRLAARLLAGEPLAGTTHHQCLPDGRLDLGSVVRRSCCLFYRIPGGGTCGDCPLTGTPVHRGPRPPR